jgi:alcohol dehydrogenase/L-iditol 2-dehydrogenase
LLSSGQIDLKPVIGGIYSLHEWQSAFGEMEEGRNIKSVVVMNQ